MARLKPPWSVADKVGMERKTLIVERKTLIVAAIAVTLVLILAVGAIVVR
jgi:hypothetical protein